MYNKDKTIIINKTARNQISEIKRRCEEIKPLVVIWCITYNHEQYIKDALEGFVMQKTDYPFLVIVHEDASTDGTAKIIKEYAVKYPDIILPIFEKENQYSKKDRSIEKILFDVINATDAKFIAFCEGDDFWTDPLKLQKQVDFLETNPEYGMCYTAVRSFCQNKNQYNKTWGGPNVSFDQLIATNTIPTLTALIRANLFNNYIKDVEKISKTWKMGDYPLWLYIAFQSKIKFLNEITGVYRILNSSASHSKDFTKQLEFTQSSIRLRIDLLNHFSLKSHPLYEKLIFSEKYLNMRIAILKHEQAKKAIKIFRRNFFSTNLSMKQRWSGLIWFFCPKILSRIANYRFHKKQN